jgi:hypothetical protein
MGTLYEQKPRQYNNVDSKQVSYLLEEVSELAKKHKITQKDVLEDYKILEIRRKNDLFVSNGDIHDKQISGIGRELQQIGSSLVQLAEATENLK